jgi:hypothetical protein
MGGSSGYRSVVRRWTRPDRLLLILGIVLAWVISPLWGIVPAIIFLGLFGLIVGILGRRYPGFFYGQKKRPPVRPR